MSKSSTVSSIDDYIRTFPRETGEVLKRIRKCILETAPGSVETIKYSMPTIVNNGNLLHFGVFKNHIGMYPAPRIDDKLLEDLKPYLASKASLRFPFGVPVPYDLIKRIVHVRMAENIMRTKSRK